MEVFNYEIEGKAIALYESSDNTWLEYNVYNPFYYKKIDKNEINKRIDSIIEQQKKLPSASEQTKKGIVGFLEDIKKDIKY
jgi:hypothetical protein